jgi:hypothetical protein
LTSDMQVTDEVSTPVPPAAGRAAALGAWVRGHKKLVVAFAIVVALVLIRFLFFGGGGSGADDQQIVFAPVERRTLQDVVTVEGEVAHKEIGSLNMLTDGRITALRVDDGDTIDTGDEVLAVDGRPAVAVPGEMPFWRPLEEGAIGFDVLQLEQILATTGFDPGPVDLDFTAQTRNALLDWQAQYGYSIPEPEPDETVTVSLGGSGGASGYEIGALSSAAAVIREEPGGVPQQLIEAGAVTPVSTTARGVPASLRRSPSSATLRYTVAYLDHPPQVVPAGALPRIGVAVSPTEVAEGEVARLIFSSTLRPSADITIEYAISGTATPGADYEVINGEVTLQAGQSQVELLVSTFADARLEPPETVRVTVRSGSGYVVGSPSAATVTIIDDSVPEVNISADPTVVSEGQSTRITVRSDQRMLESTQINLTIGGDADNGDDYGEIDDTVIIRAGSSETSFTVPIFTDKILEGQEELTVAVANPPGFLEGTYRLGKIPEVSITINDDFGDLPVLRLQAEQSRVTEGDSAVFTITSNVDIADPIEVGYVLGGSATEGLDYGEVEGVVDLGGFGANGTDDSGSEATITIGIDQDDLVEGDETLTVTLLGSPTGEYRLGSPASDTVVIESEDVPTVSIMGGGIVYEGGTITFAVVADAPMAEATSISYNVSGTADEGADFKATTGVVIIPAGAIAAGISIETIDDDAVFQPGDMIVGAWPTRVGTVAVDLGEFLPEGTELMTLTEDELTVTMTLAPSDRAELTAGLVATVEFAATGETAEARIVELDDTPSVDDGGIQSYEGEVEILGDLPAVDGATVNVDVVLEESPDVIVIPVAALVGTGDSSAVRVVAEDGTVSTVTVVTGLSEGAYIEIREGLAGNELVVVEVNR